MKHWLRRIARTLHTHPSYESLITITISKDALLHNLSEFRKNSPHGTIAPVLKSNAYGHGLIQVASILEHEKVPFYIIDSFFEARALRDAGSTQTLLIVGYSTLETILHNTYKNIRFTITSLDALTELVQHTHKNIYIHLKIDTGMNRQGILRNEIPEALQLIHSNPHIHLEGICSHFADAENTNTTFTSHQISVWNEVVMEVKKSFPNLSYWHISNSAGHVHTDAMSNLTRLGIGLYGITDIKNITLKPSLEMKTVISGIKHIKKGDSVGYNATYIAEKDMTIATIPVGYYEGIDRKLSNKGYVKTHDVFCSIVGKVSMNITTIDVSNVPDIHRNDEVIVISSIHSDKNSIENRAKDCGVIPYEIAVHIPSHLKRVVV